MDCVGKAKRLVEDLVNIVFPWFENITTLVDRYLDDTNAELDASASSAAFGE
jgi:hypothetical protein